MQHALAVISHASGSEPRSQVARTPRQDQAVSIVLALAAALAYGLSDFLGGLLSRRASPWAIAVLAQFAGVCALVIVAAGFGGRPTGGDLVWGAASGVGSGLGTFFLYRGLGGGQMNVVAPLSAVGAAVVPVVLGFGLGERPETLAWVGIACALPAIWLVSRVSTDGPAASARSDVGVRDGLLAGAGFGLLFLGVGQVGEDAGLWPLTLGQGIAVVVLAIGAAAAKASLRSIPRRLVGGALAVGICAGAATLLYQLAVRGELVSVTAVLASLYPALTVLLAAGFLHERMNRVQAVGLALAAAAVTMVALS
jgi:drug/metabolite transporter (DMT)-like permease